MEVFGVFNADCGRGYSCRGGQSQVLSRFFSCEVLCDFLNAECVLESVHAAAVQLVPPLHDAARRRKIDEGKIC